MSLLALVRRLMRIRILSATILAAVVHWFALSTAAGRAPGGWYLLAFIVGLALFGASVLRVVHRVATTPPPRSLRPLAPHSEMFMLLIAINLVILSPLAPMFESIAARIEHNPVPNPIAQQVFEVAGHLTGRALNFLFAAGTLAAGWMLLLRLLGPPLRRSASARRIGTALDTVLVAVLVLFCAASMALVYNAILDTRPARSRQADLVAVSSIPVPFTGAVVGWADVRYLDAGDRTERLILRPDEDIWPGRATPGLPVRVELKPGFLGIPWVQSIGLDHERDLRRSLAAVPTATVLRKSLITMLAAQGRWDEVRAEAEAHRHADPEDRQFVLAAARSLRARGRPVDAEKLESLVAQP